MQQMKILKVLAILLSTFCLSTWSLGDCPPPVHTFPEREAPVTLQETLERAYMQNAELDIARAGLRVTDESASQANADWRPSLSVQGTQRQDLVYPIGDHTFRSKTHNSTTEYTAVLQQNIFKGGATVANIGKTESEVFAGKAGLFDTEQKTLSTAIQAHTSVLAAEAIVNYRKESLAFNQKNVERAQARFEVGELSRTDVAAAVAQYEGAKADLSTALGNLASAKASYLRQIGSPAGTLSPANVILDLPPCLEEAISIAKTYNPFLIQARYTLEAAEYNVNLQIAGLLPEVNVQGQVGNSRRGGSHDPRTPSHPKQTNIAFLATANIPLYSQGIPNSRVRQAYQQVAQQKVALINAKRQVVEAVKIAWNNLVATRESVKGFLAQVKAEELAVQGAVEEMNVGLKTMIDVLELQQRLIDAQIRLAQSQKSLIDSGYEVLRAMGKLTARDLRLRVKYYDPDAYYNAYKEAWIQFWKGEDLRYVKCEVYK